MAEQPHLSLILVPDGASESRTFRISYRRLRLLALCGLVAAALVTAIVGSWWYFAARAVRVGQLEIRLASLEADQGRWESLAEELAGLEQQYARIRSLFGSDADPAASDLWLPLLRRLAPARRRHQGR